MTGDGSNQITDVNNEPVSTAPASEPATTGTTSRMTDVMDEVALHFTAGQEKYPGPRANGVNLEQIRHRMTRLESAYASTNDHDHLATMRRRALQLAGLCIRMVVEGDLPAITPA